jgi:hypothetical protein
MKKASKPREPSKASLHMIPEVDFEQARVRRNPSAARIAAEGIHVSRGRPNKGTETGPSGPRSVKARSKVDQILQLKVTLAEVEPVVWRRLLVPAEMTLAKLHSALQPAMGWTNSHLHCFEVAGRRIGMVGVEEDSPELEDERRIRLASVLPGKGASLLYQYDYGDDWEHLVEVEDVTRPDRRLSYPLCIAGARACPPEDCGGPLGYQELVTALANPKHPEHDQVLTWLGGHFDPGSFDANAVNRMLREGR